MKQPYRTKICKECKIQEVPHKRRYFCDDICSYRSFVEYHRHRNKYYAKYYLMLKRSKPKVMARRRETARLYAQRRRVEARVAQII